jgi:hypothetical protein
MRERPPIPSTQRNKERLEIPINYPSTLEETPPVVLSVATILEENESFTIDDWFQRLRTEELLDGSVVTQKARSSHLPSLFKELIHRLRNPIPTGSAASKSKSAAAHGLLRLKQGYPAAVLIEESRCLQVSIFNTLNINAHRMDFNLLLPDVMIVADEVDAQLTMAMSSYASGGAVTSVVLVAPA